MVKTAEKDAAASPGSPFFDPPCGVEKSGGSVIAQSSRKQRSVSMARWYLTQCALSDVFRQGFFIGRKKSQGSRVWKAPPLCERYMQPETCGGSIRWMCRPAEPLEVTEPFPQAVSRIRSRILPLFTKGVYYEEKFLDPDRADALCPLLWRRESDLPCVHGPECRRGYHSRDAGLSFDRS